MIDLRLMFPVPTSCTISVGIIIKPFVLVNPPPRFLGLVEEFPCWPLCCCIEEDKDRPEEDEEEEGEEEEDPDEEFRPKERELSRESWEDTFDPFPLFEDVSE